VKSRISPRKGLGCLLLFALPFAAVGVFMGYRTATALWDFYRMKSWVEVPAELVSVDLESHSDSDSTTYRVRARYKYSFEGREYQGDRVGIHGGSDNVGDSHERRYRELARLRKADELARCYVDPARPERAVLYRDLRWELVGFYLIFVVAFGGVGFGLVAGGLYGARKLRREEELRALHPSLPWLHKQEWRTGRIPSSRADLVTSSVLAVLWNAISAPLIFLVPREVGRGNLLALIGAIFPLVGAGLLWWAGRNVFRRMKFGESLLEMESVPGVIGGRLAGVVRTTRNLEQARSFEATLSAVGKTRSRKGDDRGTEETILWQKSQTLVPPSPVRGTTLSIPVAFAVPADQPPTDESDPDRQIVWRLTLGADVPGLDYEVTFEVPVFRTGDGSRLGTEGSVGSGSASSPWVRTAGLEQTLAKAGIRIERLPSGRRFSFPPARCLKAALFMSGVLAVGTGAAVLLFLSEAPRLFGWFLGLFDVVFLLAVSDLWLYGSEVEASEGGLVFRGGVFGIGKDKRWSRAEVDEIQPRRWMQWGNRAYYQIEVVTRWHKRQVVAKGLPDLEIAEVVSKEISLALGKS
jgi:Protein of unknown function (DUF3592)